MLRRASLISPPKKPAETHPWYAQKAASIAVINEDTVTEPPFRLRRSIISEGTRDELVRPNTTITDRPAQTRKNRTLLTRAPLFSPVMLRNVSAIISKMAVSFIPKSWNGKKTPPIVAFCQPENNSGRGTILLSDWVKTYASDAIVAVWMTVNRDQPYRNEKKRLYIFFR